MSSKPRCLLEGKVALITGAASGIGEEAARVFVENGARVVVADIQDELGLKVVASINKENENDEKMANYVHCDVREEQQVEAAVAHTLKTYGSLDIVFSNAGVMGPLTSILEVDLQRRSNVDETWDTNVRGVLATIKHGARAMVDRNIKGSIICTGSVAGSLGGVGPVAYTASKHAVVGVVRAASTELGQHGIRVNCISPFGVGTPLPCIAYNMDPTQVEANSSAYAHLKGVVLKPRHVAQAALFFASQDSSSFITGHNLLLDGGVSVAPFPPP